MPAPSSTSDFLGLVRKSGVVNAARLDEFLHGQTGSSWLQEPTPLARALVEEGLLTRFQAEQLLGGKWRGFHIGKYHVLERLGSGGGGNVYLGQHQVMRHRVAIKVLTHLNAEDPVLLQRFYREARVGAALNHPHIIRTLDVDRDNQLHYLVLEFIDGSSLRNIVKEYGPLEILRAAHYIRQAASGLQHAHGYSLIHRDMNPGNLLLDRQGRIKILDLGVARCLREEDYIPSKEVLLGTVDYIAPEQARNSHRVDFRADIYGLGATFYHLLTGRAPFSEARTMARKLLCHQMKSPDPIRRLRPEVPERLAAVVDRMMAKDPADRYQTSAEVADALAPWTGKPIAPPPAQEMPRLSLAAAGTSKPRSSANNAGSAQPFEPFTLPREVSRIRSGETPYSISSLADTKVAGPLAPPASSGNGYPTPYEVRLPPLSREPEASATGTPKPEGSAAGSPRPQVSAAGGLKPEASGAGSPPGSALPTLRAPAKPGSLQPEASVSHPRLLVLGTPDPSEYPLHEGTNLIGRSGKLPVAMDLAPHEKPAPSRPPCCYAQVKLEEGALTIEDLSTLEGTYLNGTRLTPMRPYPLRDQDVIRIGLVRLKVIY